MPRRQSRWSVGRAFQQRGHLVQRLNKCECVQGMVRKSVRLEQRKLRGRIENFRERQRPVVKDKLY